MPKSQIRVRFGNPNPQEQVRQPDGSLVSQASYLNQSVTEVTFWPGITDEKLVDRTLSTGNDRDLTNRAARLGPSRKRYAVAVHEMEQIVAIHAGGSSPDWVSSDDPELQAALCHYYDCPAGEPLMLLTNNGRDNIHSRNWNTAAGPAQANYIALTANATAAAATDTTLTGEIATASGGLIRAQATYAHTAGTNTTTLTKTFTANASDVLPVTIAKIGVFNAASAGTMEFETLLSATATLSAVGDSLTVTETITAG